MMSSPLYDSAFPSEVLSNLKHYSEVYSEVVDERIGTRRAYP